MTHPPHLFPAVAILAPALILGLAMPAPAETPTVLLLEGVVSPAGFPVDLFRAVSSNDANGFAVSVSGGSAIGFWGSRLGEAPGWIDPAGVPPQEIRIPLALANDGSLVWLRSQGGRPSVWQDDVEITPTGQNCGPALPIAKWDYGIQPGVAKGLSMPVFTAQVVGTRWPCVLGQRGLFLGGSPTTPLVLGNEAVPGLSYSVPCTGLAWTVAVSSLASHWIAQTMRQYPLEYALLLDGEVLLVDGTAVRTGEPVPASLGGRAGEVWTAPFRFLKVNEQGDYVFAGTTSWQGLTQDVVVRNGSLEHRSGDTFVEGEVVNGVVGHLSLNASGDLAAALELGGARDHALVVNDRIVARTGDPVDLDGDGIADPGTALGFWPRFAEVLSLTDRDENGDMRLYSICGVDPAGSPDPLDDLEALLVVPVRNVATASEPEASPAAIELGFAPNPFRTDSTVRFTLDREAETRLTVHDVTGRRVTTLRSGRLPAGNHAATWNGTDGSGAPVPAGVYFCRLVADGRVDTGKLIRLSAR